MALKLASPIVAPEVAPTPKLVLPASEIGTVLAALTKSKGAKIWCKANSIPPVRRLPTGIFEFDYGTGGGFPRGGYTLLYGPESSCKTNIAYAAVAQAQREADPCNVAVWINLEQSFDPIWAAAWGVDTDRLIVINPGYGEEAVDCILAMVHAIDVCCLVVDSLAVLVPSKEVANSADKFDMGTASLLTKRLVNKLMVAFSEERKRGHEPAVICINQTRFKLGVMFGDPETIPGGEAQKFLAMLRVRVYGKNVVDKDLNKITLKQVHCVVKKSKIPVRQVDWTMDLCMVAHDGLGVGQTNSFNVVKGHLQSMGLLEKLPKGYVVDGYTDTCPLCEGTGKDSTGTCGICKGEGWVPHYFKTLADLADLYRGSPEFSSLLQGYVIDTNQKMFLVDDPAEKGKADTDKGEPVEAATTMEGTNEKEVA